MTYSSLTLYDIKYFERNKPKELKINTDKRKVYFCMYIWIQETISQMKVRENNSGEKVHYNLLSSEDDIYLFVLIYCKIIFKYFVVNVNWSCLIVIKGKDKSLSH